MCDGSVHYVSDDINISDSWNITVPPSAQNPSDFGVWECLMSAGDGYDTLLGNNSW